MVQFDSHVDFGSPRINLTKKIIEVMRSYKTGPNYFYPFQFIVALNPNGRALMTRDMELIRKIFAEIQNRKDVQERPVEIQGVEEWIVARHVEMLFDAGLVEGRHSGRLGQSFPIIMVKDLSMAGHDFAAVLANDSVWSAIKTKFSASELASMPLRVIEKLGGEFLEKWALDKAGLGKHA